jgi:hypothetical protein
MIIYIYICILICISIVLRANLVSGHSRDGASPHGGSNLVVRLGGRCGGGQFSMLEWVVNACANCDNPGKFSAAVLASLQPPPAPTLLAPTMQAGQDSWIGNCVRGVP